MGAALVTLLNVIGSILKIRGQDDLGQYARLAASLVQEGATAKHEFVALAAELQAMVDDGREPTADMVATVRNRRKELSAALQAGLPPDRPDDPDPEDQPPPAELPDNPVDEPPGDNDDDPDDTGETDPDPSNQ